jgi:hypothetical protein
MELLKKYKGLLILVLAIIICFIVANQFRVAYGGEFVAGVMYSRYVGYLLIAFLIFRIGVKTKLFLVHNVAMIGVVFILFEIVFYSLIGAPTKENKGFDMPQLDEGDIQEFVGYLPRQDTVLNDILVFEGDTSFNVDYSIDGFRKRITPKIDSAKNSEYALFFGCSIAYGYGLEDDQTIPYNYQSNGDITAYNFGYNGHGTNHMAARLQTQDLSKQVDEKNGKAFYLFFWDHIPRAVGTMSRYTSWLHFAPYYYMDNDSLKRNKMFKNGRPVTSFIYENIYQSNTLKYFEIDFPLSLNESHFDLIAEMIDYSKSHYKEQFGNDEFYTVIMPTYKQYSSEDMKLFIELVESKGVEVINLEDMVYYKPEYTLKNDAHPNAKLTKLISKELYNRIK